MKTKRRVNKKSVTLTCSVTGAEIRQHLLMEKQRKLLLLKAAEALSYDDNGGFSFYFIELAKQKPESSDDIVVEILRAVMDVIVQDEKLCHMALVTLVHGISEETGIPQAIRTAREALEAEVS